ncbi:MAG: hypothetical protein WBA45_02580 [Microthrixaceae bacterium]
MDDLKKLIATKGLPAVPLPASEVERRALTAEFERKAEEKRVLQAEQAASVERKQKTGKRRNRVASVVAVASLTLLAGLFVIEAGGSQAPAPSTGGTSSGSTRSAQDQEVNDIVRECVAQGGTPDECVVGAVIVAGS